MIRIKYILFFFLIWLGSFVHPAQLFAMRDILGGTVLISGDTSICPGNAASIRLQLTGEPPFDIYLSRFGAPFEILNDVYAFDTIFNVVDEGIYRADSIIDASGESVEGIGSATVNILTPPSAEVTGTRSICVEDSTVLSIELTGVPPWNVTMDVDGDEQLYTDIQATPFSVYVSQPGVYEPVVVQDSYCYGITNGSFELDNYSKPGVTLYGQATICEESSTPLTMLIEGSQPWEIAYAVDGAISDTIRNIPQSPFFYNVSAEGIYTISYIKDEHGCLGDFSGTAQIIHQEKTPVQITNLNSTYAITSSPVSLTASPSGGEFKGNGVISSTSTFYPDIAASQGSSPHEIIYYYHDPETDCLSTDTAFVNVIEAAASLIIENEKDIYCFNGEPISLIGANIKDIIGEFSISGGSGLVDHNDNTATVYPGQLSGDSYTITYSYYDGNWFSVEKEITIEFLEEVYFIGLTNLEYCANANAFELTGNEQDGVFYGSGVVEDSTGAFYFNPVEADIGINTLTYAFTSINGCTRDTSRDVEVYALPDIDFTVSDSCIDERHPFQIQFLNLTKSEQPVSNWGWNFNDAGSGSQNTSTQENPTHVYNAAGSRAVQLTATTNVGCEKTVTKTLIFGDKPISSFTVSSECFNSDSAIHFTNTSTSKTEIASYFWEFRYGSNVITSEEENTSYTFSELQNYDVRFITETVDGCRDTSIYTLQLKPTIDLSEGPYFQDFQLGKGSWSTDEDPNIQLNSWTFGNPGEYFSNQGSSNRTWYTDIKERVEEQSWVKSPCFNFLDAEKPFISFDIWRYFEQTRDGAALQYTTNNGDDWWLVGGLNDGINWYNSYQIIGLPGNQSIGWSNIIDNQWIETRHRLDSLIGKTNVQFRIVYGSDGTGLNNQGLAFDNIWISERQHQVLIEHFTNIGDSSILHSNALVNNLTKENSNDVINIQYHTGFPNVDTFNLINPVDPSARLLFYGISETPYSVVDGQNAFNYSGGNEPGNNLLIRRSLQDPTFSIKLDPVISENTLQVAYALQALREIPSSNYTLYIAVVENDLTYQFSADSVQQYQSVFRKFLPDAAGINFQNAWLSNQTKQGNVSWNLNSILNKNNIEVIAFLQNQSTREVVQVTSEKDLLPLSEKIDFKSQKYFTVFPNPAGNQVMIKLYEKPDKPVSVYLYDLTGTLVLSKKIVPGVSGAEINLENIPTGIYFIRLGYENSMSTAIKLIKAK